MPTNNLTLILGGHYHDFAGFESFIRELLEPRDFAVSASYDTAALRDLSQADVVMLYTCHVEPPDNPEDGLQYTAGISDEETRSLAAWVGNGGGLVAAHSATTIRPDNHELKRLVGGRFLSHPPRFPFTVCPLQQEHPLLEDAEPFTVTDELYTSDYAGVDVHAVAVDRGRAYPMLWSRTEGNGRVVHLAPGHDASVWANPGYQAWMLRAVNWASGS